MKNWKHILCLLLALVMLAALCACGSSGTTAQSGGSEATAQSEAAADTGEPKVLRIGTDGEPSSLSEIDLAGGNACQFVGWSVYGTLWKINTNGDLIYLLAESYEQSDDGLTITIHLRDTGFNNGDPLTASDVLFSLRRSDEAMGDRTAAMDLDNSTAQDDKTLVLKLKQASPTLIDDLGVISIISESWTEDYTNQDHIYNEPLCCGPYYIQDGWTTGNEMVLLKNPYYYNTDNLAYDEIDVAFVAEETTRYLSFDSGEYDICYLSESENIDKVRNNSDEVLFSAPVQLIVGLSIDTENENSPFKNQNLRLAMMYAVDVPSIVSSICGDAYTPATSILPSTNWAYKDETYGYDPDLAKQYLDQYYADTGTSSVEITLNVHEGNIDEGMAEAIQYAYSQIGITTDINVMDFGSFFTAMNENSIYLFITQYSGSSDPGGVLNCWNPVNIYTMYDYPEDMANLFTQACYTAGSQADRTALFAQLQDMVKAFGKFLPLYEGSINYGLASSNIDISNSVQADGYLFPDNITVS